MLVLTRKLNESIIINDNIRVTVVGIRGNQIRLGIEAPGDVRIYREELVVAHRDSQQEPGRSPSPAPALCMAASSSQ